MKKFLIPLALLLLVVVAAFGYSRLNSAEPPASPTDALEAQSDVLNEDAVESKLQASYLYIATESGELALDLLKANAQVETQDYGSAGQFVTAINGLAGSNEYYWAFYVNNEYAEQGASQTVLQEGDVLRFVYEAVSATPPESPDPETLEPETIPLPEISTEEVPNVETE